MSNFRDLIARMAIDPEFARHTRANPDAVARQYRLDADESEQLRGLADAATSAGPTALGARLSKMGGITSALQAQFMPALPDLDPLAEPVSPIVPGPIAPITPGPIIFDMDVLDPRGDPDGDGIPNILDSKNNNPNTTGEAWGDHDNDGKPNLYDPQAPGNYAAYKLALNLSPDSDGDGIKDLVDAKDHDPNKSHEALGDNDHDGIPNYLDKKFNFPVGPIFPGPIVLDPGGGGGEPPLPPPGDEPTPPPPPVDSDGDPQPSTPDEVPGTPEQQPILLAQDAVGQQPIVAPPEDDEGGIGTPALIVGGAALAAGAAAGVVAAKMMGDRSKEADA